jgi:hypothetical protein
MNSHSLAIMMGLAVLSMVATSAAAQPPEPCVPGARSTDMDRNGIVDLLDFNLFRIEFHALGPAPPWALGDFDCRCTWDSQNERWVCTDLPDLNEIRKSFFGVGIPPGTPLNYICACP